MTLWLWATSAWNTRNHDFNIEFIPFTVVHSDGWWMHFVEIRNLFNVYCSLRGGLFVWHSHVYLDTLGMVIKRKNLPSKLPSLSARANICLKVSMDGQYTNRPELKISGHPESRAADNSSRSNKSSMFCKTYRWENNRINIEETRVKIDDIWDLGSTWLFLQIECLLDIVQLWRSYMIRQACELVRCQ